MPTRITHYDQGDTWTPQATFKVSGAVTDPTNVTVRIKKPDGTVTVLGPVSGATGGSGITRVSQGIFKTDISLDDAGYWFARFEGTGAATAAEDHQAVVDPSEFYESAQLGTRALVGLAETKDWLQVQNIATDNDLELARVINDISERFHEEAEREFKPQVTNPSTRSFDMTDMALRRRIIQIGDLTSATTVEVIDTDWTTILETVTTADYTLHPLVRKAWEPYRRIEFNSDVTALRPGMRVRVTGTWGFPSVPGNVRQAVLDAVVATMDRDVENYSQDLAPVGIQATNVIVAGARRMLSMPPSSFAVAWSYRDPVIG